MYLFPIAAVTNYHKCSGFKQHRFIYRTMLVVRTGLKSKCQAQLCPLEPPGEDPRLPFPAPGSARVPRLMASYASQPAVLPLRPCFASHTSLQRPPETTQNHPPVSGPLQPAAR